MSEELSQHPVTEEITEPLFRSREELRAYSDARWFKLEQDRHMLEKITSLGLQGYRRRAKLKLEGREEELKAFDAFLLTAPTEPDDLPDLFIEP